ncbi:MAG: 50S ribosomal protein L4 [Bacteroidales bacterium]|jgi:large subunit ribosomal protein L4|nr:50S ribosomal protein L4 [Bacteroidales bacterium]MBO5769063.1 50S ribosomal protein L4 [Bacteroidales bacterium]MBO5818700.1 50S ribosomal protein L4 [Bacteroidales bacterium]MBO5835478.1 50S ribosomal protein L4 [Bacteroidales bacterium]MBO5846361.1 50S ribosomal protein L4 [Bacteroidales bacterium]
MELSVYNIKGEDTGRKIALSDSVFAIEPNDHVLYLAVKQHLANSRQGTHKSKERSEISGSTKKLGRQKGGGGARHGDINSPLMVGGGRVFGPVPRDYSFKLNKKVKALARKSALTYKMQDSAIKVVEDFQFEAPKTKDFVALMNNLQLPEKKVVLVLSEQNKNVYLSARNLPKVEVVTVSELDTYKIMVANCIVFMEGSVAGIENVLNA